MNQMMRAGVITGARKATVAQVKCPEPGRGELRIRLEGCGVCGSNLAVWEGRPWFSYPANPGAPGHEGWGTVDTVGSEVTEFSPGDRVAFLSSHAFAEQDIASADAAIHIPAAISGPFPGEALACAFNIFRRAGIKPGHTVVVVGAGFIGSLLIQLACRSGASVLAVSRRGFALDLAHALGADQMIPLGAVEPTVAAIRRALGSDGADRVIEAVGQQATLDIASAVTRVRGRLIIAGYHQDGLRTVNMQEWNWRGIDVINAHERDATVYLDGMRQAAHAIASGNLDPTPLYTHTFPLDQLGSALNMMRDRPPGFLKALVTL